MKLNGWNLIFNIGTFKMGCKKKRGKSGNEKRASERERDGIRRAQVEERKECREGGQ